MVSTLLILFISFRYEITLKNEEDKTYNIKVTWLLHIIKCHIFYEDGAMKTQFYLFGIHLTFKNIFKLFRKNPFRMFSKNFYDEEKNVEVDKIAEPVVASPKKTEQPMPKEKTVKPTPTKKKNEKFFKNKKIKTRKQFSITKLLEHIKEYEYTEVIRLSFILIRDLFNLLKPKKFSLTAEVGLDDPADTGYILACTTAFFGLWMQNIVIKGNFEEKIFQYNLFTKGKFTIYGILYLLVIYCFKKPIKRIIVSFF